MYTLERSHTMSSFKQADSPGDHLAKEIVKFSNCGNTQVKLISEKVLQITGNLVKFTDFVYNEITLRKKDLKEIHVFATERIFVDQDFYDRLGRELEITLISPRIEIFGRKSIYLGGKSGANHSCYFAKAGNQFNKDGENGLPGKAGGNGGHLYVICEEIMNAASLTVDVRGGNGGDGQNGGYGCGGVSGRFAQAKDLRSGQTEKDGDRGTSGGNGGDGGMGGYPGHGGSVEVVVLEKHDGPVNILIRAGEKGNDGKGGSGGMGGKNGNGIQKIGGVFLSKYKPITCNTYASCGVPGQDGANSNNMVLPPPKKCTPDSKATAISELHNFCMNLSSKEFLSLKRRFLDKIDSKVECQHVSMKSLARDLLQLELTSRNFHDPNSLIGDHEAFQCRLDRCVDQLMSSKQSPENPDIKHVIKLLYAQSISKVLVLKEQHSAGAGVSGSQAINLLGYFDIIKDTINRLKESSVEGIRREALKTYHDHLKAKCSDTKDFISRIVLPSIAQAKREIQEEINCCAGEVELYGKMVKQDLKRRTDVARSSSKIQFWDIIKTLFTVLELGIGVAQWFNGSQFACKALLGIAGFQKWVGMDDDKAPENLNHQPSIELPSCLNNFHVIMEQKMTRKRKEWELVTRFVESLGNHRSGLIAQKIRPKLETWKDQLTHFQRSLNSMKIKKPALDEQFEKLIAGMEKNKTEILIFLENMLEATNKIKLSSELIDSIQHLLVDMALTNCDSLSAEKNTSLIKLSHEPLSTTRNQLETIQEKYSTIFRDIMPLINAVLETVAPSQSKDNLITGKGNMCALKKFEKWRIQTTLRKLKDDLASFFNGLESKSSLLQAVQRMEEGLSVLIDLYDMMDSYEESKLLSGALAGIKLNTANGEDFVELQETVDKIGYLLKANTFILDYNQAVHAFKQWIFPFANQCPISSLNFESDLTSDFVNCGNNLEKLAAEYKCNFDMIYGYLLRYRSMKMDFDDVIFRGMFSSKSSACPPFYVWKWEEWGDMIQRLLKGEEVELRADLVKAEELIKRKMGAVKFKTVQLKIKHKNGTMAWKEEEELNKLMNLFKVTMVHSGISYYKVFDQCFVMRGSRNEYCYSYDGAIKNSTFEKCESQGDYLLSPFTIWKFRLTEILEGAGGFERLGKFVEMVDLELWGDGLFLDERKGKEKRLDEKYLKDLHVHYELV